MTVWALLSVPDDERQYAGNRGYADELRSVYRYDSGVPNSRAIREGDTAVLRDRTRLLGIARVERIDSREGLKERLRCPECGLTKLKERKTKQPRYRCECGHETDHPRQGKEACTLYDAWFGASFVPLDSPFIASDLSKVALRYNGQHAMQAVDPEGLSSVIGKRATEAVRGLLTPGTAVAPDPGFHGQYRAGARPGELAGSHAMTVLQHDPALLERALHSHANVQDGLARLLSEAGLQPMSPAGGVPYDLAWSNDDGLCLAEVKSLTGVNEVAQMRSGIGQLVDYASELEAKGERLARLFLVVERCPTDVARWTRACARAGITLAWAPDFVDIL